MVDTSKGRFWPRPKNYAKKFFGLEVPVSYQKNFYSREHTGIVLVEVYQKNFYGRKILGSTMVEV
jgi:hypothetical protein